jgi:Polyketide cyclase / dehydrase and lipid transport
VFRRGPSAGRPFVFATGEGPGDNASVGRARAAIEVVGTVEEAEALWYDLGRWPTFVDGFAHVVRREGWPDRGGMLVWDSTPAGRGRVVERVTARVPGQGQTSEVEDPRLSGTQTVAFASRQDGTGVTLSLDYRLKQGIPVLRTLLDVFFVGRALRDSLRRTLVRFARELEDERGVR